MKGSRFLRALPAVALVKVALAGSFFSLSADLRVTVHNSLPIARAAETIEIAPPDLDLSRARVFDGTRELLAQPLDLDGNGTPESLVFQTDLPANGTRTFTVRLGEKRVYRKEDFRVYGRFNRERFDDFAWENDRVAHRTYGAALETWQREPLTSSTVDVWLKRTRRLVLNDWYMVDDYHRDHGEGADFYSAGKSRGCGGSGLWRDGKLVVSKNFRESRVLANGPIRLVFELVYPLWDAQGVRSETKRITLDAGQNFNRIESRYDADGELPFAAGIKKQPTATLRSERAGGWIRAWDVVKGPVKEPGKEPDGEFGCAVITDPASIVDIVEADGNQLIIAKQPAAFYVGSGWNRSGDFKDVADWDRYVEHWTQRVRSPLRIEVSNR